MKKEIHCLECHMLIRCFYQEQIGMDNNAKNEKPAPGLTPDA